MSGAGIFGQEAEIATHTVVTQNNLTAVTYSPSPLVLLPADLATISQAILIDPISLAGIGSGRMAVPGAFVYEGFVFIPNRQARIKLFPGDVVCVTSRGFPIVISADEIANGNSFTYT